MIWTNILHNDYPTEIEHDPRDDGCNLLYAWSQHGFWLRWDAFLSVEKIDWYNNDVPKDVY